MIYDCAQLERELGLVLINLCCHFLLEIEITRLGKGLCDTDERKRGIKKEASDMYTLLYFKWITSKDLLCSTGNFAQCYVAAWMGERFEGEWIHAHVWLSPFTVHLKLSQYSVHIVNWLSVQFSSVQSLSHVQLCNPRDCSTPEFLLHHQLLKLAQTHVHQVSDAIQPSHPLSPLLFRLQSLPASGSFPMSQFFTSGGQILELQLQHQCFQ